MNNPNPPIEETVQGLRLNCQGDHRICHRPYIEEGRVPISLLSKPGPRSDAGEQVGIPLMGLAMPQGARLPWLGRHFPDVVPISPWNEGK